MAAPALDRLDEGVLDGVLGQAQVSRGSGEAGRDPPRLVPVEPAEVRG
jgi:hypothetical protein